jgi:hypothetical protein
LALTGVPPLPQISTTKGTGGDVIILEEAAYIESDFFYVSGASPLLLCQCRIELLVPL